MDVGLVCDQCDTFNAMASATCSSCGTQLALGGGKKAAPAPVASVGDADAGSVAVAAEAPGAVAVAEKPAGGAGRHAGAALAARAAGAARGANPGGAAAGAAAAGAAPQPLEPTGAKGAGSSRSCRECGAALQPGFRFCGTCGARVDVPAAAGKHGGERRTMFFGAMQAARAKLVLIKGDGLDGVSFTLAGQDHVAGRVEGPLLFQDDPFLSPKHANFYYKDGKLVVRDEGSKNGIFVRTRAPTPMRSGDTFLVGEQVMRLETTPPETAGLGPDADGTYVFASPRRAARMRLVQLLRGGDVGLIFRATSDVISLGRDGNDVNFPEDPFISGHHAQVAFTDAGVILTDLGSKNGTFVRITGDTALSHGDYVFMGQQLLRVEIV
jgi:pSer/pThr/pTyr-binding forkhead associated (FHA) protein